MAVTVATVMVTGKGDRQVTFGCKSFDPHVKCSRPLRRPSGRPLRRKSMREAELPHGFSEERKNRGKNDIYTRHGTAQLQEAPGG